MRDGSTAYVRSHKQQYPSNLIGYWGISFDGHQLLLHGYVGELPNVLVTIEYTIAFKQLRTEVVSRPISVHVY